jgi:hypothetical protein
MQISNFTLIDNTGRPPVVIGGGRFVTAASQCSNSEIAAMEQLMATTASGLSLLTAMLAVETQPYDPEMVKLLLQLRARGPVAKFKNKDAALKRLLPSRG